VPLNPKAVLAQLDVFNPTSRHITSESSGDNDDDDDCDDDRQWITCTTPKSILQIGQYSDYIDTRIQQGIRGERVISPTLARVLDFRSKESNILVIDGNLAIEELHRKENAERDRIRRKSNNFAKFKNMVLFTLRIGARDEREALEEARLAEKQIVQEARTVRKQAEKAAKAIERADKADLSSG